MCILVRSQQMLLWLWRLSNIYREYQRLFRRLHESSLHNARYFSCLKFCNKDFINADSNLFRLYCEYNLVIPFAVLRLVRISRHIGKYLCIKVNETAKWVTNCYTSLSVSMIKMSMPIGVDNKYSHNVHAIIRVMYKKCFSDSKFGILGIRRDLSSIFLNTKI